VVPRNSRALWRKGAGERKGDLYDSLIPLLRTKPDELDAYIETVACNVAITNTETHAHCHFIALDGNKRPRVKDFARFLGTRITDFAIPRSEIERALDEATETGSTAPIVALNDKARNLFTSLPQSGEGGEVLLSTLAETILRLPQILTKMVLKTSAEMHVHGSDGIHLSVNRVTGNLALYWGESKLHKSPADAVRECFRSVAPFLLGAGGSKAPQERDLQLMRDGIDLNDTKLEQALKRYLNPDDPMFKRLEYRGLCLIGFDSDAYPTTPNSKEMAEVRREIKEVFRTRSADIKRWVCAEKIKSFAIEAFCLPFPSVDEFRRAFRIELGFGNGDG